MGINLTTKERQFNYKKCHIKRLAYKIKSINTTGSLVQVSTKYQSPLKGPLESHDNYTICVNLSNWQLSTLQDIVIASFMTVGTSGNTSNYRSENSGHSDKN